MEVKFHVLRRNCVIALKDDIGSIHLNGKTCLENTISFAFIDVGFISCCMYDTDDIFFKRISSSKEKEYSTTTK